uniref:Uncharacterized protein n=1 Tax=Clytia hemisphaerica TaxID=252671 RepID=A0A7M5XLB4_9CNID
KNMILRNTFIMETPSLTFKIFLEMAERRDSFQKPMKMTSHPEKLGRKRSHSSIGGDVHMMIGVKHLKYFPKHVYQMPSGLAILESLFTSSSGGRGVIAGPHPSFSCFNVSSNFTSVYHNTIHPIKTPLLGFNADHPTSLKYLTQNKEDQSNQSTSTIKKNIQSTHLSKFSRRLDRSNQLSRPLLIHPIT